MSDKPLTMWSCYVCGPHPKSRANWCEAGCGRDYQQMTEVPVVAASALLARADELDADAGLVPDSGAALNEYSREVDMSTANEKRVAAAELRRIATEAAT